MGDGHRVNKQSRYVMYPRSTQPSHPCIDMTSTTESGEVNRQATMFVSINSYENLMSENIQ